MLSRVSGIESTQWRRFNVFTLSGEVDVCTDDKIVPNCWHGVTEGTDWLKLNKPASPWSAFSPRNQCNQVTCEFSEQASIWQCIDIYEMTSLSFTFNGRQILITLRDWIRSTRCFATWRVMRHVNQADEHIRCAHSKFSGLSSRHFVDDVTH